ncbi:hypothetical protein LCGC14_0972240 [marine sediment metagenome]|uniref:Uncharacterized protein n=1 Tax=marine sediment metagenome TaxID=412755 RepID=A0A0F9NFT6_9ZZZZ
MKHLTKVICLLAAVCLIPVIAFAQLPNSNYRAQGGTNWVIGGTLTIADGGAVSVSPGGGVTATTVTLTTFTGDSVELGDERVVSSNTATSDDDYLRRSYYAEDSNSVSVEIANIDISFDDVTSTTKDSTIEWSVMTNTSATTPTAELALNGAALYPVTDAGLDLGTSGLEFNDLFIDGTASVDALQVVARTLVFASDTVSSGSSSVTATVAGTDSDDLVFATANTAGGKSIYSAVPGSNQVVVTMSGNVSTTTTIAIQVWQD